MNFMRITFSVHDGEVLSAGAGTNSSPEKPAIAFSSSGVRAWRATILISIKAALLNVCK